jgi:hypothetical protein
MPTYFYEFKDKNNRNNDDYRHKMALIKDHLVCYDFSNTYKINEPSFKYLGQGIPIYGPQRSKILVQDNKKERKLAKCISEMLKYDRDNIRVAEILDDCIKTDMFTNFIQISHVDVTKINRKDGQAIYVNWIERKADIT